MKQRNKETDCQGERVLKQLKNKLIVSCQARVGWPMYGAEIMAAFAVAACQGGPQGFEPQAQKILRKSRNG